MLEKHPPKIQPAGWATCTPKSIRRLEENPDLEAEVRALYARWDRRDPEVVETWERTRQWSLDGFAEMYKTLGIHFDRYYFPSAEEQPGKQVVDELIQRGIAIDERPEGPVIVRIDDLLGLTKEKYRVLVVLRSDGTALYSTEDLALAEHKFSDYPDLVRSIYVVDVRQSLHFQQVFKTLEIAGRPWAGRCQHLGYEIVNLPGNVIMASREGTVVLLENLLREAVSRARKVVEEKNPELSEEQKDDGCPRRRTWGAEIPDAVTRHRQDRHLRLGIRPGLQRAGCAIHPICPGTRQQHLPQAGRIS